MLSQPTIRRHPAEWEPHTACWLAFPHLSEEWPGVFEAVCTEFAHLCHAIADVDVNTGKPRGETLKILVFDEAIQTRAMSFLADLPVEYHCLPYDDVWLRDTGPIFIQCISASAQRKVVPTLKGLGDCRSPGIPFAISCRFNVWGEKFDFPHDRNLSPLLCRTLMVTDAWEQFPLVLEGGSLETDGQGTCLTTRQCLLNPNRNPLESQASLEYRLQKTFGYQKIIWLERGLINDHTDGHIDTLARFVRPGVVMVMAPQPSSQSPPDPNAEILTEIIQQLTGQQDAQGRSLKVIKIPAPGPIDDGQGHLLPASYLNFYISNTRVLVPIYGSPHDQAAVKAIGQWFPNRQTLGLSARAIITQGGAFHCMTQQQI